MATPPPPPLTLDLVWEGDLRFAGRAGDAALVIDGGDGAGPSPVQALAFALAGCMATDVVSILIKGRLPLEALTAHLVGDRRGDPPRRFEKIDLHFVVTGAVPPDRVERALALSRERYCSVWHSLRPDIAFTTSFEIQESRA